MGSVDDFDGWAQRLNVAPGEHELTVYLKGYQTYHENVLFRPGATLRVEHVMQPLAAGQPEDARPVPSRTRPPSRSSGDDYPPPDVQRQPDARVPPPRRGAESGEYGSLSMRVQPLDAEVIVDGEPWQSPEAGSLTLQLADGVHRVTVRKDGYRVYNAEVRVRRGDTTSLNVSSESGNKDNRPGLKTQAQHNSGRVPKGPAPTIGRRAPLVFARTGSGAVPLKPRPLVARGGLHHLLSPRAHDSQRRGRPAAALTGADTGPDCSWAS